jgi:hypothetical protein
MHETNYQTPTQPTNPVKQGDSGRLLQESFPQRKVLAQRDFINFVANEKRVPKHILKQRPKTVDMYDCSSIELEDDYDEEYLKRLAVKYNLPRKSVFYEWRESISNRYLYHLWHDERTDEVFSLFQTCNEIRNPQSNVPAKKWFEKIKK